MKSNFKRSVCLLALSTCLAFCTAGSFLTPASAAHVIPITEPGQPVHSTLLMLASIAPVPARKPATHSTNRRALFAGIVGGQGEPKGSERGADSIFNIIPGGPRKPLAARKPAGRPTSIAKITPVAARKPGSHSTFIARITPLGARKPGASSTYIARITPVTARSSGGGSRVVGRGQAQGGPQSVSPFTSLFKTIPGFGQKPLFGFTQNVSQVPIPPPGTGSCFCVHLNQADRGRIVTVFSGEQLIMDLAENRQMGLRWLVSNSNEQVAALQSTDPAFHEDDGLPPPPDTGNRTYTFIASEPGTTHLQFQYTRYNWRTATSTIIQQFGITVQAMILPMPMKPGLPSGPRPLQP
ncbi:MAG TPA: protease inhibitor I42 family protein [Ktedonosporobacter sp.]|nr:protease inhibitor I42 family protein [Ktedonosporobacter sp.]